MNREIILVDEQDNEIGYGEKLQVHRKELLHRAFSVFIFDWSDRRMLIQRRAAGKYHSGGLWTNACCSHPGKGEDMETCLRERLKEELGFAPVFHIADPKEYAVLPHGADVIYACGSFRYYAKYEKLSEHEIDHVFLYSPAGEHFSKTDFTCSPDEIEDIRWITLQELDLWLHSSPGEFTAWFEQAYGLARKVLNRQAGELCEQSGQFCRHIRT